MLEWLSLQINFIQQKPELMFCAGSNPTPSVSEVAMTRISGKSPGWKQHLRRSAIGTTHDHRYQLLLTHSDQSSYCVSPLVFWCF